MLREIVLNLRRNKNTLHMIASPDKSHSKPDQRSSGSKKSRRTIWFHLHFWVGWIAAIPLILICFTGGVLAFDKYLREWEIPEQYRLDVSGDPMTIDGVVEVMQDAEPKLIIRHLGFPQSPRHAYGAYVTIINEDGTKSGGHVIVNPYTGELTHSADKFTISGLMVDLHRHLAAGKTGQQIVGISSLVLAVTSIFGLVLWWPMRGRTFVRAWKRGKALDWHNAIGLVAMVPLIIMAITGICFTWGNQIFPVLEKLQSTPVNVPDPVVEEVAEGTEKVPLSVPLAIIHENFPDGQVTGVQPTGPVTRPYVFFVRSDGENYRVCMNPFTGAEMSRDNGKRPGWVSWYRKNFGKLHTMGYNTVTSAIWGLLSAIGSVLAITGLWISVKRWKRRRRVVAS